MSNSPLPYSWSLPTLAAVADVSSGIGFPNEFQGNATGDLPFYKVSDISFAVLKTSGFLGKANHYVSYAIAAKLKGHSLRVGSTVFAKIGEAVHLNRRAFVSTPCLIDNNVMAVKARFDSMDRYLHYFLKTVDFGEYARSTTVPSLRKGDVEALLLPLAPESEQTRIANQLDTLLARVKSCNDHFDAVPALLKRFRQAVLDAATLGTLTENWRDSNGIAFDWKAVQLRDIADVQGGVTKDAKKQSALDEDAPYLRVANVQRGYIDLTEVKTIRVPAAKLEGLLLANGDVLFNEGGDLDKLGRGWVWEGQIARCTFQNHVFRARLFDKANQPKFISWWGNSRGLEYFLRSGKQTTNLASINKTMLAALPIHLPSAMEQTEIVRRVEALFALADRIEARCATARTQAQRLTPLVLAKAFRGELVPQDPSDEPASALLARLAAQKTSVLDEKVPVARKQRA